MGYEEHTVGDCRLILGDCREVLPTLEAVDAVIMDPPYGVQLKAKRTKHAASHFIAGYVDTEAHVLPLIDDVMGWCFAHAKRAVVTPGVRMAFAYPRPTSLGCIYCPNGAGMDRWGFTCAHPILYYGPCPYLATSQGSRPNSFSSSHPGGHVTKEQLIDHPCPKPIAWMEWLVKRGSLPGETVLDPFAGSFTTGVACLRLGRSFIGIEIERRYFDVGCARLEAAHAAGLEVPHAG